ncbi:MAG: hypothetical protein ACK5WS_06515 [Alphaproteobacteria bacterium]|nr:hypothetical protein [Candidatus Jidaibacter sp.]
MELDEFHFREIADAKFNIAKHYERISVIIGVLDAVSNELESYNLDVKFR